VPLERRRDVLVDVGGERAGGVPELLSHHLHRYAGGQPEGGVGVAQVVQADAGQPGRLGAPVEGVGEPLGVDGGPVLPGEH